ncbi:cytochrome C [Engelhardtia mirabilis]|uniref:Cytochrome C n=1 Tax=Engelhardtia mirabilis TaxID=2528011 RepID=A0A518BNQ1_9BACT|nr:hypothetical protein Pla133_37130 [Planctomycetes bacterium Pla133]QDV02939.1 hypothetical protein Pla86_37120 [Planctomycetes bacterium Pla86]
MSSTLLQKVAGPRVDSDAMADDGLRYRLPYLLLLAARILILVSLFLPYWEMDLVAPQYPDNLHLTAYVNNLGGDVAEIDGLNHYIGMRPLGEAAQLERRYGVFALVGLVVMLEIAALVHRRWATLLILPGILFPAIFLLDLHLWMSHFGTNLDPYAPLSNSIEPFVPPILGVGEIGQFKTIAEPGTGLWLAIGASVVMLLALWFHRRAFRPLVIEAKSGAH